MAPRDVAAGGLRIAVVSPLYESVPPQLYGGTERVVSYLTEELVRLGHKVTLFATAAAGAAISPAWGPAPRKCAPTARSASRATPASSSRSRRRSTRRTPTISAR